MNKHLIWLFLESLIAGLLAVLTPFVYAILPLTVGYLSRGTKSKGERTRNLVYYALSIVIIFTALGVLIAFIIKLTGLLHYADHWIFNIFFFRLFLVLALSLMGAFSFKLPEAWVNSTAAKAKSHSFMGIFFMALTLPSASFASTAPIIVLVLVFAAKMGLAGPITGLAGFATGLSLPFLFPHITTTFFSFKSFLNNVKVVLGFFAFFISLKFLSNADVSLGLHLLDREIFIAISMLMFVAMGLYMLGSIKLLHDYAPEQNIYNQQYVTLTRLFIAIAAFTFAIYLLPGMWGAPLKGINGVLPRQ